MRGRDHIDYISGWVGCALPPRCSREGSLPTPRILTAPLLLVSAMAEVDPTMGADSKEAKSRLEDIKYYTSLFLGTLCIVCVFGFLFLVPFVLGNHKNAFIIFNNKIRLY